MVWSIVEVSRMTGITSRTLRHYHAIGLLVPARTDASGRRFYGQTELVRLQQILVLRALDLGLPAIAEVLDGESDQLAALRRHRRRLLAERDRFARLADSVSAAIDDLEGGRTVTSRERLEQWFGGVARGSEEYRRLEQEGIERYGESGQQVRGWSDEKYAAVNRLAVDAHARLAELAAARVPADDPRTLDAVGDHHAWLRHHWEPSAEAYAGLGRLYADPDDRFREHYESVQEGLADYLRDAMAAYADRRM